MNHRNKKKEKKVFAFCELSDEKSWHCCEEEAMGYKPTEELPFVEHMYGISKEIGSDLFNYSLIE